MKSLNLWFLTLLFLATAGSEITVGVYSLAGALIQHLDGGTDADGYQVFIWSGRDRSGAFVPPGVLRLPKKGPSMTKRISGHLAHVEAILNTVGEAIITVDTSQVIRLVNREAERIFGYEPDALYGVPLEALMPEQYRARHHAGFSRAVSNEELRTSADYLELEGFRKDEVIFPLEIRFTSLVVEGERFFTASIRDITERKRAQAVQQQAEAAAAAAEQANRAKSAFLANMSHELRTPLNAILGYAQILSKEEGLNEKQRSNMATIQHSGEHLLSLINDILDMSKIEAGRTELEPNEFSLPDFLDALAPVFQARAEQTGIQFFYETLTELPIGARTDERKLRQVLINLLGNAVKFTDEGSVALKVGYEEAKVRFQVEDTGIGIAPESLEEIFEEFKQVTDPNHSTEGTGLGLPISSKLVQLLGGQLQVKSVLGEGSVFWFELELEEVEGFVPAVKERERRVTGFRGASCKVLVVDDVEANRSVLVDLLEPLGFEVREAVNGRDGIDRAIDWRPGVILMDLRMPVLDGNAAMEIRRESWGKEVVLIAATANAFEVNRQASIEAGADDFLVQPFREGQLLDLLAEHLGLQWEYAGEETVVIEEGVDSKWILPSREELLGLMQLSLAGNLLGIGKRVDELLETDAELKPFVLHLRQLVEEFKVSEIQDFLRPLAGSGKGKEDADESE